MNFRFDIGDHVSTDFDGRETIHSIIARKISPETQSGASYRLLPNPRKASCDAWLDEDWLKAAKGYSEHMEDDE